MSIVKKLLLPSVLGISGDRGQQRKDILVMSSKYFGCIQKLCVQTDLCNLLFGLKMTLQHPIPELGHSCSLNLCFFILNPALLCSTCTRTQDNCSSNLLYSVYTTKPKLQQVFGEFSWLYLQVNSSEITETDGKKEMGNDMRQRASIFKHSCLW